MPHRTSLGRKARGDGRRRRIFEDAADEDCGLVDGGGQGDGAVVVGLIFCADDGGDKGHKGQDVGYAGGVVLDSSAKGGEFSEGAFAEIEEGFEEGCEAVLLFRWYGEGSDESVHDHAGEGDAL